MQHSEHESWVLAALEKFQGRLVRYAARITHDEHLAMDVVQHAFLKLCDQNPTELDGRLAPWLYTVCRNRAVEILRKEGRMHILADTVADSLVDATPQPDEVAAAGDTKIQLRTAVQSLTPPQQEVVDLWSDGFSYREISDITGRTETNIRVMVHRAIKAMREHPAIQQLMNEARGVRLET